MANRIIAVVFLVLVLGFVGLMASVTLFLRDPLPIVAPAQTLELASDRLDPPVIARLAVDGSMQVRLSLDPPRALRRVRLRPAGGTAVPLTRDGAQARAQFTRPGRWELVLDTGDGRDVLPFILQD